MIDGTVAAGRCRSKIDDTEDRAVVGRRHTNLGLRAVLRTGHLDRRLGRDPQQRHAVAAGAALDRLDGCIVERDGFAAVIVAGHDPARRFQFHRHFLPRVQVNAPLANAACKPA